MEKIVITGGIPLIGEVNITGAKNAAVAIIAGSALVEGTVRIENLPSINDVTCILDILETLGAKITMINSSTVEIDSSRIRNIEPPYALAKKMRASYYIIGVLLGRFKKARVPMPGGCDFGVRPIDQHIKGFELLGAKITVEHGVICAEADELIGTTIYFDANTVGATINVMLAATMARGLTVIENAAKEPHIVDLANFLNSMGADIMGAGTDVIKIRGVKKLHGGSYAIIPDQIEAGTFMVAAAATKGDVLIKNIIPKHLECVSIKLIEMGVQIEEFDDSIRVCCNKQLNKVNLKTLPYPGFPTDMQPQMAALMCIANGTSIINETIWPNRFRYVEELKRMGAKVQVDGTVAIIEGISSLMGAQVNACDLRAGAALLIAGMCANGETIIENIENIERGYENVVGKFRGLGAKIDKRYFKQIANVSAG